MLTRTFLVVAVCGIGASVPTLAQDETRIFQYSPIARLVGEGQYRAEVWKRENASGRENLGWSTSDVQGRPAEVWAAPCENPREYFDVFFPCTQAPRAAKAGETVKKTRPPQENGSKR